MVAFARIANPRLQCSEKVRARSRFRAAEQSVGSGAVSAGAIPVILHAGDLGLEQSDPRLEFVIRVGIEVLASESAGSVCHGTPQGTRAIVVIH
jgi:hypothetical protein